MGEGGGGAGRSGGGVAGLVRLLSGCLLQVRHLCEAIGVGGSKGSVSGSASLE